MKPTEDELQCTTNCFRPADGEADLLLDDEEDKDVTNLEGPDLDELLKLLDTDAITGNNTNNTQNHQQPSSILSPSYHLKMLHQKGRLKCKYQSLAKM